MIESHWLFESQEHGRRPSDDGGADNVRQGGRAARLAVDVLLAMLALLALPLSVLAAPGDLDTGFDGDGKVVTSSSGADLTARRMAIQADGKIVVAGEAFVDGGSTDVFLARYNVDGSLDISFGGDGIVISDLSGGLDGAAAVVVQDDGKLLVAGRTLGTNGDFALLRYETDGDLDPTFGTGGWVATDFDSGVDAASAVVIDGNRIIVAGGSSLIDHQRVAIARYDMDGNLDPTFDGDGKRTERIRVAFNADEDAAGIAVQSDGKLVVAGVTDDNTNKRGFLARYLEDGSLDPSFGTGGLVLVDAGLDSSELYDVLLDGTRILVAGARTGDTDVDAVVARYDTTGVLDPTFATGGIATTAALATFDLAVALVMQEDGRIIISGLALDADVWLVRFDATGTIDTSFGAGGRVTTEFAELSTLPAVAGLAIQNDGRVVAAGGQINGGTHIALARYETAPCSSDAECADDDPCTRDRCLEDGCENAEAPADPGTCLAAGKASLQVRDGDGTAADQLKWQWKKGAAFSYDSLGDPSADTAYTLCVYDTTDDVALLAMSMVADPSADLWLGKAPKSWSYSDAGGASDGITRLQIKAGAAGKTKIKLSAAGDQLPLPGPAGDVYFTQDPQVVVQLHGEGETCWTSSFTTATVNTPQAFKAR